MSAPGGVAEAAGQAAEAAAAGQAAEAAAAGQAAEGAAAAGGGVGVLDAFLAVQAQRAAAYHRLDEGFRFYIRTGAEGPFRFVMQRLTEEMAKLSIEVIAAEGRAAEAGLPEVVELLRGVQGREREKLRLTLALQALKAAAAQQRFSWQQGHGRDNAAAGADHVCGLGCGHAPAPSEPTQAEFEGAVREAYQELQEHVTAINDALDEARQMREDLAPHEPED